MIWAMDKNRLIGKGNDLPWHIPNDLKHFKETTKGKAVIMGLRTFYSLGKPLPNRRNIVLHFDKIKLNGAEVYTSILEAIEAVKNEEEAFVIGGASIYRQFLEFVDKLYITYIDHNFEGDIFFPEFDMSEWELISERKGVKDEKNPYDLYFRVYTRKS